MSNSVYYRTPINYYKLLMTIEKSHHYSTTISVNSSSQKTSKTHQVSSCSVSSSWSYQEDECSHPVLSRSAAPPPCASVREPDVSPPTCGAPAMTNDNLVVNRIRLRGNHGFKFSIQSILREAGSWSSTFHFDNFLYLKLYSLYCRNIW